MTTEEHFERMNGWLDVLKREGQQVRIDQHIFWEVQGIIQRSPRINALGSSFYQWMAYGPETGSA